jgi:hypothetical protein
MSSVREVVEGIQAQGVLEEIHWALDITQWGSAPTTVSAKVFDAAGQDVTTTVMPGTAAISSPTLITLPALKSLTAKAEYRVEVYFTVQSQKFDAFFIVKAE